jgi:purine-binding chemotaxis protein CheW
MSVISIIETRQYLTFQLSDELFGLSISNVREILEVPVITKVPKTPDYMIGVVNLRGSVLPVLDMRLRFGLACNDKNFDTCIIVVEVDIEEEGIIAGILVDSVNEVFELESTQIEPPPKIGTRLKTDFIKGMGKHGDSFIILLDIDKIFSFEG